MFNRMEVNMKKKYSIYVDCANCANLMEEKASKVEGVESLTINFMAQKMTVEYNDGANADEVFKNIVAACKKVDSDFEVK